MTCHLNSCNVELAGQLSVEHGARQSRFALPKANADALALPSGGRSSFS
jgi:hypothetical protein